MEEIWKTIENYPNYQISNLGRIKSLNFNHKKGDTRILNPFLNRYGYVACNLMYRGKRKRFLLHRLIGQYFIPNPNNLATINHKDGNKQNNDINNLEWLSAEDNLKHSHLNNFVNYSKGENHYTAKLSTVQVKEIKRLLSNKVKGREIAKLMGVSEKCISAIKTGRSRKYE